ncbi:sensor histidine kinase ResE [Gottschalkia purinilytica]|uniref:histidine kinase n=2 Tax=Gottschalkia purinilytica TaxID=1503 RepID=A0A0L0W9W0_GOTPU|nr:sensor histidine kinase ResE [Gottschalkia purinilytica]
MKVMKQNSYRLLRLINNFIDLNKMDVGFFTIELKNKNIVKTIEDITLSIVEYTNMKGIEVIFDTNCENISMAFDEEKIERVMLNLLSNAIKFTSSGGKIYVSVYDKENKVEISVKDTGIGIPEDMIDNILNPFIQVDPSLRKSVEGNGLGLTLVKSIVELHDGNILVQSEYKKWTKFIIELPKTIIEQQEEDEITNDEFVDTRIERINVEFSDIYSD